MHIVDDPVLSMLANFLEDVPCLDLSDADFLRQQAQAIKQYTKDFPFEERQERALEWIELYARDYRRQWQKEVIVQALIGVRCSDCPLVSNSQSSTCVVLNN
ncbi:MAG: hypothetical protein CSA09_01485 [Candidatus Contendobacter odensis]|uniref:Uncharacterized protein n=1 Tax=Candidatus Contendibacter odensensis TaxID=1400860 RepID=A0A2G6PG67_9GAMM|nr:MAG: hypothetical protein CSA09_01485 [Candidatus Contendobacter odensis]